MLLEGPVRELLDGRPFAVLATMRPDPRPSITVFAADDPPGSHRLIGRLTPQRVTAFSA